MTVLGGVGVYRANSQFLRGLDAKMQNFWELQLTMYIIAYDLKTSYKRTNSQNTSLFK